MGTIQAIIQPYQLPNGNEYSKEIKKKAKITTYKIPYLVLCGHSYMRDQGE